MWIFWALLSAILAASRRPFEKKIIHKLHHFTYGLLVQCVSLPILAALVIVHHKLLNPLSLGIKFWVPVALVSAVSYPLNMFLYKHAVKDGELSKVMPLQSLLTVFALLLAWLTLGEVPGILATFGIMLTVLGIYALGLKGKRLHHPLQPFREDTSSRAMLALMLLVSATSVLDKVAIGASNPLFYSLASSLGAILALITGMHISRQRLTPELKPLLRKLGIIGTLQGTTYATYMLAIASGPIAYVSALRSTNILMSSMLGILLFKEKLTKPKLISFLFIIAGAVFLALGSGA